VNTTVLTRPLRSSSITEPSTLLRVAPPQALASVSRLAMVVACASPLASKVWFLQFHAKACIRFTPSIRRPPSALYSGSRQTRPRRIKRLWFWRHLCISTRHQGFTHVRLSDTHLPECLRTFDPTLTTTPLERSSLDWFETRSCKPIPRGLPSSFPQLVHTVRNSNYVSLPCASAAHLEFWQIDGI
jgi:hypothetical protein